MICEKCGFQNEEVSLFCQSCGAKQRENGQPQQVDTQGETFSFNGKQFLIDSVDDVVTAGDTDGVTYSGLLVVGKYSAYIKVSFNDYTPEEVCTFSGSSVIGIGNRGSAIKDYKAACQELFQVLGRYMVEKRVQKIIDGTPIKIITSSMPNHAQNWALRNDGIIYYNLLKEKIIPKEEFSRCDFKDPIFHVFTNSGKHYRLPALIDQFKNLCIPEIMALLYR